MKLSHKKTNKNRKKKIGGGDNQAAKAVIDASTKLLVFIKNKLARFAGLVPIQEEEKTNEAMKNLGETADKSAASGIDAVNSGLSSPQVKTAVAVASQQLATTLKNITKVAQEKLNDPEFQAVVINTVKLLSDFSLKLASAAEPALNKTIDETSQVVSQLMNKFAVSMANASLSFLEAIPVGGEFVAVINLLHNIATAVFAVLSTMLKFTGTGANLLGSIKDNWNKTAPLPNNGPTLFSKISDYAKEKYQALKPHLENLSANLNSKIQEVLKVDLNNPNNLNAIKQQVTDLLNNKELFSVSGLSANAKSIVEKLEDKLSPVVMSLPPDVQAKLKELKNKMTSGVQAAVSPPKPVVGQTGGLALQKRVFKSIDEFKKTNRMTMSRKNKKTRTQKRRQR
jgi:hypothetical protein